MKNLILFLLIIYSLTSCSVVNKIFHKNVSRIDSTSVTVEKKDSIVDNSQIVIHKDSSKAEDEIVIEFAEYDTTIRKNSVEADDYFTITREGISTNKPIKSVRIKTSQNVFNYDSLADHSKIQESELKQSETQVKSVQKETVKEKEKKKFLGGWWISILAFIITYLIIRYRKNIWAFIRHKLTGL